MPTFDAQRKAAELQRELARLTRLTEIGRNSYESAFRSHTGRREPLPGTGDLSEITALVVDLLAPCLDPNN